jgi:hypothetical protein
MADKQTDEWVHNNMLNSLKSIAVQLQTLETIKKLYTGYYNTGQDTEEFAVEFFYTVGEIMQGKELKNLDLKYLIVEELL